MKKTFLFLFIISLVQFSCKDSHDHENENELITTLKLTFTEGGNSKSYSFKDLDGDGGKSPIIESISLKPNTTYSITTAILDESKSPVEDITEEVNEEGAEHLMVYTSNPTSLGSYTYGDKDVNGLPIGLVGTYKTNSTASGTLKVQLRHQPPVNGKRTKDGSPAPGSDDINVDFPISIK